QVHHALALRDPARERVEHEIVHLERRVLVAQLGAANQGVHPRQQFRQVERLGEVVVGAAFEALHPRLQLVAGREQEDRREHAPRPELRYHAEAVPPRQHHVEHDAAVRPAQRTLQCAVGCFWSMERAFDQVAGVVSATVGYTGGTMPHPSYEQVSTGQTGHLESVQVVYDPRKITYERVVDAFWHDIDPTQADGQFCDHGTEYHTAIFYRDTAQHRVAAASRRALEGRFGRPIATEIARAAEFYPA